MPTQFTTQVRNKIHAIAILRNLPVSVSIDSLTAKVAEDGSLRVPVHGNVSLGLRDSKEFIESVMALGAKQVQEDHERNKATLKETLIREVAQQLDRMKAPKTCRELLNLLDSMIVALPYYESASFIDVICALRGPDSTSSLAEEYKAMATSFIRLNALPKTCANNQAAQRWVLDQKGDYPSIKTPITSVSWWGHWSNHVRHALNALNLRFDY